MVVKYFSDLRTECQEEILRNVPYSDKIFHLSLIPEFQTALNSPYSWTDSSEVEFYQFKRSIKSGIYMSKNYFDHFYHVIIKRNKITFKLYSLKKISKDYKARGVKSHFFMTLEKCPKFFFDFIERYKLDENVQVCSIRKSPLEHHFCILNDTFQNLKWINGCLYPLKFEGESTTVVDYNGIFEIKRQKDKDIRLNRKSFYNLLHDIRDENNYPHSLKCYIEHNRKIAEFSLEIDPQNSIEIHLKRFRVNYRINFYNHYWNNEPTESIVNAILQGYLKIPVPSPYYEHFLFQNPFITLHYGLYHAKKYSYLYDDNEFKNRNESLSLKMYMFHKLHFLKVYGI